MNPCCHQNVARSYFILDRRTSRSDETDVYTSPRDTCESRATARAVAQPGCGRLQYTAAMATGLDALTASFEAFGLVTGAQKLPSVTAPAHSPRQQHTNLHVVIGQPAGASTGRDQLPRLTCTCTCACAIPRLCILSPVGALHFIAEQLCVTCAGHCGIPTQLPRLRQIVMSDKHAVESETDVGSLATKAKGFISEAVQVRCSELTSFEKAARDRKRFLRGATIHRFVFQLAVWLRSKL